MTDPTEKKVVKQTYAKMHTIKVLYTWECFFLSPFEYPGCGEGGDVQDHPADAQKCKGAVNESHLSSQKDG